MEKEDTNKSFVRKIEEEEMVVIVEREDTEEIEIDHALDPRADQDLEGAVQVRGTDREDIDVDHHRDQDRRLVIHQRAPVGNINKMLYVK